MKLFKHLPRFVAAALFAATASTAVVVADATHAGQPATGILASAPQAASAAVIGVGVGFGVGPHAFYRYGWRGGSWVRIGVGYGYAPGWFGGYYLGYGPPAYGYPYYYARGYHPYFWGGYHGWYGRGYYGWRGYAHPFYGWRR